MAMGARVATLEVAMEMGMGARVATLGAVTMEMVGKVALEVAMEMEMGARVATLEEEVTVLGEAALAMVAKVGLMEATTGIVSEEAALAMVAKVGLMEAT